MKCTCKARDQELHNNRQHKDCYSRRTSADRRYDSLINTYRIVCFQPTYLDCTIFTHDVFGEDLLGHIDVKLLGYVSTYVFAARAGKMW